MKSCMNASLSKRSIPGCCSASRALPGTRAVLLAVSAAGCVQMTSWPFIASPDVSRARRVRRADDAVADHRVGLNDAAELREAGVHRDHAGRDLDGAGV